MFYNLLITFSFLLACPIFSFTQGFPWYGGDRHPYQAPDKFIGFYYKHNSYMYSSDIELNTNHIIVLDNSINDISSNSLGLTAEYWVLPNESVLLELGISFGQLTTERIFSEPFIGSGGEIFDWEQKNNFQLSYKALDLMAIYKKRVYQYLNINGGIGADAIIAENRKHILTSLNSSLLYNNENQSIELPNTSIENFSFSNFNILLGVSYDIPIVNGIYTTTFLDGSYHLPFDSDYDSFTNINVGIRIFYGLDI